MCVVDVLDYIGLVVAGVLENVCEKKSKKISLKNCENFILENFLLV